MLRNIILALCLFVSQIVLLIPAQALSGYTSWNNHVSKLQNCGTEKIECSPFVYGKKIYFIVYSICQWSGKNCSSVTNYYKISNDPYALLEKQKSAINAVYSVTEGFIFTYVARDLDDNGLHYDTYKPTDTGLVFVGSGTINVLNLPSCPGYIEGYGCPNSKNSDTPLDRTTVQDGPCDICSKEGNPFDIRSGAKVESVTDINFPILVQRLYYSKSKHSGMFGINWRSNFDKKVNVSKDSNNNIISLGFVTPDDQEIIYTSKNGGALESAYSDESQYNIILTTNRVSLIRPDSGREDYDLTTGRITSESYKGNVLNYQYNTNTGLLSKVSDSLGKYIQINYNGNNYFVSKITASNGDVLDYTYENGNVSNVHLNNMNQITYEYTNYLLSGKRDANNIKYASFTYDEKGRGIENKWLTDDGHEIKKYKFSYGDNTTTVTQDNGMSKLYTITNINYQNKIQSVNWNGYTERNSFDSNGNVSNKTDFNNVFESYTYDSAGRILTYSRDGKNVKLTWDTTKNLLTSIEENSANGIRTTSYTYDSSNNVLTKSITTNAEVMTWSYVWSVAGKIAKETNPNGLITNYTYYPLSDNNNSLLLNAITTNGGQNMVINSYDTRGNPTSITVNGINKTMSYDYKGRLLSETINNNGNNITNNYTYDSNGNLLTSQMADGYALSMSYDSAGRMLGISDNMGGSSTFNYDDDTGEVLTTEILQNNTLVRARNKIIDSFSRTTEMWNATSRTKTLTSYDSYIDKPNRTTDANSKSTMIAWDNRNNAINIMGTGNINNQTYDIDNNKKSVTVNNQQTTINYDDFGRITQLNSADTGNHTYVHNTATRKVTHTDAKGIVHSSTSDLNGNPIVITHTGSNTVQTENYGYNTKGELTSFNDNSGSTTYIRNNLGQITSKTQHIFGKDLTVQYDYNEIGQKITDTYPSGMVVSYAYNNGFLTSINASGATIISSVNYNSMLKEAISWNLGGNNVSIVKDSDGLLTNFIDDGIFDQNIITDNEGNIISLNDNVSNNNFNVNLHSTYSIESGNINGKQLYYNITTNNNLFEQRDGITSYNFSTPYENNKTINITDSMKSTSSTYLYDNNGNTTLDNKGSYTYDLKNNMMSSNRTINSNNATGTYSFNALGHRVVKNVSGQVKYFAYNENNQVIGEYDNNGNVISEYVYFGLRPVAVKTNGVLHIVHTDYLGTPRVITSGTNGGSVVWEWKNDNPYGNNKATGSIEFNLRFAGQYYDSESGLHYNIHRTYNPEIGRYMQSDPIGLAGGSNTYNYVNRNPLSNVDPLGLDVYSGTRNAILTEAIHNPISVPKNSLGIGAHSNKSWIDNNATLMLEAGSELYNKIKLSNSNLKSLDGKKDLNLSPEALAQLLNGTFDISKYDSIYLEVCRLGILTDEGVIYGQKLSNILKKPVVAYTEYIWAEKSGENPAAYTGYYTNPLYNWGALGRSVSSSSYYVSPNAKNVEVTFYPK